MPAGPPGNRTGSHFVCDLPYETNKLVIIQSLPSRERGSKCVAVLALEYLFRVAPFAGAWIEIVKPLKNDSSA